jgi:16S rRNA (uracil1498-N3)-methyltransferase
MRENHTLTRLYIDKTLASGAEFALPREQVHYLNTVLRMSAGDQLRLFNPDDGEWQAEIITAGKRAAILRVNKRLREPYRVPDIWLCFPPVRKHRNMFIIEKGTELGVRAFQPILTNRTQHAKTNLGKMQAHIVEAAQQTERLCLPSIMPSQSLDECLGSWDPSRSLIMADEAGDCPPAHDVLKTMSGPAALMVGPEGGFTPIEREQLRDHPSVTPVSLGPRILRADTAAISLLTLWQAVQGDWRENQS